MNPLQPQPNPEALRDKVEPAPVDAPAPMTSTPMTPPAMTSPAMTSPAMPPQAGPKPDEASAAAPPPSDEDRETTYLRGPTAFSA